MRSFNSIYNEIMHESLNKKILQNIDPKTIKQELIDAYKEYASKIKDRFMVYREGEENVILEFLNTLYGLSVKCEQDFLEYKTNPKKLHITLSVDNRSWIQYIYDIQLRQPAKLIALKYLNFMGLYVPVEFNSAGFPQYKFHLINRFLQLNELYKLKNDGKLDERTSNRIYMIIVDDEAKKQLSSEIKKFNEHHKVPYTVDVDPEIEKPKPVVKKSSSLLDDKLRNVDKFFSERKPKI